MKTRSLLLSGHTAASASPPGLPITPAGPFHRPSFLDLLPFLRLKRGGEGEGAPIDHWMKDNNNPADIFLLLLLYAFAKTAGGGGRGGGEQNHSRLDRMTHKKERSLTHAQHGVIKSGQGCQSESKWSDSKPVVL